MPEFDAKIFAGIVIVFFLVLGVIFFVLPGFSGQPKVGYHVREPKPLTGESTVSLGIENGFLTGKTFPELVLSRGKKNFLVLKNNDPKKHKIEVIHFDFQSDSPKTLFGGTINSGEEKRVALPFLEATNYVVKCPDCGFDVGKPNVAKIFAFSNSKGFVRIGFGDRGFEKKQYDLDIVSNDNYTDETSPIKMFEVLNSGKKAVTLAFLSNNKSHKSKYGFQPYRVIKVLPGQTRYFELVFTRENVFYNFVCVENCPDNARNVTIVAIK